MGTWIHRLSDKNIQDKKASCSNCGFTDIRNLGKGGWRCKIACIATKRKMKGPIWKKPEQCEICDLKNPLVMDHDHKTNKFRGWICQRCNMLLYQANDSPQILISASKYLHSLKDSNL